MEFFNRDKPENDNIQISQSIIDFMNQNASEEPTDNDLEDLKTRRSRNHLNLNLAGGQALQTEHLTHFKDQSNKTHSEPNQNTKTTITLQKRKDWG